jgi:anti-anti-sigma factor
VLDESEGFPERCPRCLACDGPAVGPFVSTQAGEGSGTSPLRPGELRLELQRKDVRHQVLLTGELDIASAPTLEAMIGGLCADGASEIVLDLGRLMFIDSFGLGTIIHVRDVCGQHQCDFSLVPGPPSVHRLFELTGLTERFLFKEKIAEPLT